MHCVGAVLAGTRPLHPSCSTETLVIIIKIVVLIVTLWAPFQPEPDLSHTHLCLCVASGCVPKLFNRHCVL